MGITTKTGDKGQTSLYTGERVDKDALRVEAYGIVDEINSALALARATCKREEIKATVHLMQKMNVTIMSELASYGNVAYITDEVHIAQLDDLIGKIEREMPPLKKFIIPGDTLGGAALDMARTTIRRAERAVWRLKRFEPIREQVLIALNRMSDLCFLLMRQDELLPRYSK